MTTVYTHIKNGGLYHLLQSGITVDGWVISPKHNCRLIEKHWPCNEGGDNETDKT